MTAFLREVLSPTITLKAKDIAVPSGFIACVSRIKAG